MALSAPATLETKCDRCAIRHVSICGAADFDAQNELNRASHTRTFLAGETITAEGEEPGIVGNVVSGVLRMSKTMADGRQQIVGLLFPSDMFGRVFSHESNFAIEAATDVTLCCFDKPAFERIILKNPQIEHEILLSTLDELDAARDWMMLLGCQTVLERLASFMIIIVHRTFKQNDRHCPAPEPLFLTIPVSRRDMATYLGTTVETISRKIQYMARKKVIRILDPKHFEITNSGQLGRLSGREDLAAAVITQSMLPASHEPARPKLAWFQSGRNASVA